MEKTEFYALQDELQRSLETFLETFERYKKAVDTLIDNYPEIDHDVEGTEDETVKALLRLIAGLYYVGEISYEFSDCDYVLDEGELYEKVR